ncbi:hypothetical protein LSTR_LSTR008508 [Laodelphax striatellus]|uniref:Uncharacterized protein n=1 Tax=Laodelphax striatellus TaxID=195883 RepID=A0A482WR55_LAOST|nr:hypothetical protein LSTR_LSTR008508 [Laodelphax striatellus]
MRTGWVLILYSFTCCTLLLSEGLPEGYLRKQEAIHNQQSKTGNQASPNDVLNDSSSLETVSPHESKSKLQDDLKMSLETFCGMGICKHPFDPRCLPLCCNNSSLLDSPLLELDNSQETVTSADLITSGNNTNQDFQQDISSQTRTEPKTINEEDNMHESRQDYQLNEISHEPGKKIGKTIIENQTDAEFHNEGKTGTGRIQSDHSLPSKPTKSDSESSDPVSTSNDDSSSKVWIIILVISLPALIIVLFLFRQWRLRKMRESYLAMGLCPDLRPSPLIEVVSTHSD